MKGNHWFIAGIIVFLVLMFAIECRLPKKFVWNPTFSHCFRTCIAETDLLKVRIYDE